MLRSAVQNHRRGRERVRLAHLIRGGFWQPSGGRHLLMPISRFPANHDGVLPHALHHLRRAANTPATHPSRALMPVASKAQLQLYGLANGLITVSRFSITC